MNGIRPRIGKHLVVILSFCCIVVFPTLVFSEDITNARVVEMTKSGLGDDIVIARIKTNTPKFSLTDSDLSQLKKDGVSDKVIAAMLEADAITVARVTVGGKPTELHTFGQAKVGGRLGHTFTYGMKSVKQKAFLPGQHSSVIVSPDAFVELELPRGDTIDNYMIVKLDRKDDRRELEVGSSGGIVGGKSGVRAEAIMPTKPVASGTKFRLQSDSKLKPGEYVVYIVGSTDNIKGIFGKGYDFTVE